MNRQRYSHAHSLITALVTHWPTTDDDHHETLQAARSWLAARQTNDVRMLAHDTLETLDILLAKMEGGPARDALFNARQALARYTNQEPEPRDDMALEVKLTPAGGVTLARKGQHLTISDEDLEQVREAINIRKREVRKRQRREGL